MLAAAFARRGSIGILIAVVALGSFATAPSSASSTLPASVLGKGVKHGIDVSHWQPRVNWGLVRASGIRFAIAKATEGTRLVDKTYLSKKRGAGKAHIRFTAYHYARPGKGTAHGAARQADFFIDHANLQDRDLVPALDLERGGHLRPKALTQWVLAFLDRIDQRLGVKPMIYTSPGFWAYRMGNTDQIAKAGYRVLWVAHYGTSQPSVPGQHWDGNGWTIWQWTQCGRVLGINGCVDRDALAGVRLKDLTIAATRSR